MIFSDGGSMPDRSYLTFSDWGLCPDGTTCILHCRVDVMLRRDVVVVADDVVVAVLPLLNDVM